MNSGVCTCRCCWAAMLFALDTRALPLLRAYGRKEHSAVNAVAALEAWVQGGGDDYSVYVMRLASRRFWRIGQTRPVKVVFMSYRNTLQADILKLVAKKL